MKTNIFLIIIICIYQPLFIVTQSNLISILPITSLLKAYNNSDNNTEFAFLLETAPEIETLRKIIGETLKEIFNSKSIKLSPECHQTLFNAYTCIPNATHPKQCINTHISEQFISKLIEDSSKNQNDVTTYSQCMRKYYTKGDFNQKKPKATFLMIIIDKTEVETQSENATNSTYESYGTIFGICAPKNCSTNEYKDIIYEGIISFWNMLNLKNKSEITVIEVNDDDYNIGKINWKKPIVYIHLIPAFLILFQLLCITFNSFPYFLFKCRKKSYKQESINFSNDINNNTLNINRNSTNNNITNGSEYDNLKNLLLFPRDNPDRHDFEFKYIFNLSENGEEFFNSQLISKMNNLSCLSYIAGIRGISMILLIFGFVFFALFNSPTSFYLEMSFINMMKSLFYGLFYFGLRYSPRILLSCSGYTLFFKFISFLDDEFDEEKDRRFIKYQEMIKQRKKVKIKQSNYHEQYPEINDKSFSSFNDEREVSDIHFSSLLKFYLYQFHKYCLFILMIFFLQYSLYYLFIIFNSINPMWEYFHINILENKLDSSISNWNNILKSVALMDPFLFDYGNKESFLKYCWLIFCEIDYFILSTFIIFIGYKYQLRFDRFFLIIIFLLFIAKIIYFIFMNNNETYSYYSTLYFYFFDYGKIFFGVLWNYIYYLIGIMFSTLNYIIQKDTSLEELHSHDKQFLIPGATLLGYLKEKKKKTLFIISFCGLIIIILFSLGIPIILAFNTTEQLMQNHLVPMQMSYLLNYFMLIDIEMVVFILQLSALLFYIKGDNFITNFLSHSVWIMLNKIYFSFILLLNPVILYVLYQSVARVNLTMFNNIIYSFICGFLVFVIASIHYIFFELPYKRLIKLKMKEIIARRRALENNKNV